MISKLDKLISSKFFWSILAFIFLFATFPGKGGFEGGQREIQNLVSRTDNWGFMTPFFYGEWPNLFGQWRFSLVAFQLLSYWLGFYLFFYKNWPSNFLSKICLTVFLFFSSTFASQLWRDSTLFAFVFLGLGILKLANQVKKRQIKLFLYSMALVSLIFGSCFKPVFSPLICLMGLFLFLENLRTIRFRSAIILGAILLSFFPYALDKSLSNHFGLIKTYPEQQPMIYDLASVYCWGNSAKSNQFAEQGLQIIVRENVPIPAVCASLNLTSWDNLHMPIRNWIYNSPLIRLGQEKESQFISLRSAWIQMIINNPREYLLVKMPFATQVLTMANAFVFPKSNLNFMPNIFKIINNFLWLFFYFFSNVLDKARIFTLGFALFLGIIILIKKMISRDFGSKFCLQHIYLIGYLLCTLLLVTFAYVAGNGRYVLPFVLFFYAQILAIENSN